ncbi:MAG: phosphohistidine phosphatase SixA [Deltaproteobacteria bacterium]|nr:phosphohistidine phosphatase SixA [Deltaproteobacteria bacterium]
MEVYLVQHAEAKSEEEDPERGLTDKGFNDMEKAAAFLKASGVKAAEAFHSGKKRALQTAEVLSRRLKCSASQKDGLSPMDDPNIWRERVEGAQGNLMLVGHMPHLGRLSALLLAGDSDKSIIDFRMGSVVCLRRKEAGWAVAWMITPEIVR